MKRQRLLVRKANWNTYFAQILYIIICQPFLLQLAGDLEANPVHPSTPAIPATQVSTASNDQPVANNQCSSLLQDTGISTSKKKKPEKTLKNSETTQIVPR